MKIVEHNLYIEAPAQIYNLCYYHTRSRRLRRFRYRRLDEKGNSILIEFFMCSACVRVDRHEYIFQALKKEYERNIIKFNNHKTK